MHCVSLCVGFTLFLSIDCLFLYYTWTALRVRTVYPCCFCAESSLCVVEGYLFSHLLSSHTFPRSSSVALQSKPCLFDSLTYILGPSVSSLTHPLLWVMGAGCREAGGCVAPTQTIRDYKRSCPAGGALISTFLVHTWKRKAGG